jgi:hypothetical protein
MAECEPCCHAPERAENRGRAGHLHGHAREVRMDIRIILTVQGIREKRIPACGVPAKKLSGPPCFP